MSERSTPSRKPLPSSRGAVVGKSRPPVKPVGSELDARLRKLAVKASKDDVRVEHLLAFAALGDAAAAAPLRDLKQKHSWHLTGRIPGSRTRNVPLGRWAEYVCVFLEGGGERLTRRALEPEEAKRDRADGTRTGEFALGVLKAVNSSESVRAVLSLVRVAQESGDRALAMGCADALSRLLVFKPAVLIDSETARQVREFLHELLVTRLATQDLATVYSALRAVGDERSLALIESRPAPKPPWESLQSLVVRAIRQRLRRAT